MHNRNLFMADEHRLCEMVGPLKERIHQDYGIKVKDIRFEFEINADNIVDPDFKFGSICYKFAERDHCEYEIVLYDGIILYVDHLQKLLDVIIDDLTDPSEGVINMIRDIIFETAVINLLCQAAQMVTMGPHEKSSLVESEAGLKLRMYDTSTILYHAMQYTNICELSSVKDMRMVLTIRDMACKVELMSIAKAFDAPGFRVGVEDIIGRFGDDEIDHLDSYITRNCDKWFG